MKRGVLLLILFVAVAASAVERSYRSGILKQVEIKDVTSAIPVSTGAGQTASIPIPLGLNFEFQVQSDMIVYVAGCWSKGKRSYSSEWVVNDPVEFRVEKDKLFLKRPSKGELRLALMMRLRVLPTKDVTGEVHQSVEALPPFATRQTVPECH